MKNEKFYEELDKKLDEIIANFPESLKNRLKQDNQKKSHALMLWFLKFYSGIENVEQFITDGHGDHSCDIILDKTNTQGETVFYIVQSKWNKIGSCNKHFEQETLKSFLSDMYPVLRGDKNKTENEKFNSAYSRLVEHVKNNGEVKIIYLSLKNKCFGIEENICSFENQLGGRTKVEAFDINRLKMDYINRTFKKSIPPNPLDKIYNPSFEDITIRIAKDDEKNSLKVTRPFEAVVFNIIPRVIYELVERYGVSLFDQNVRNPLLNSQINSEITSSLKENPSYFWYYNNGITAITRQMPPISNQAESFKVKGIQIINGAQTAYSIHQAYSDASIEERAIIDEEARITLRLLKSGGKDFDLKVTRFTNSQNPVSDRDFWSHDEIQSRIQSYFYTTDIWYEKRAGEFRRKPRYVREVSNMFIATAHLAFWHSDPVSALDATISREHDGKDLLFTSHKDHKDGLYEKIFNKETTEVSVFASFCMLDIITEKGISIERLFYSNGLHLLGLSKIILEKYLKEKFAKNCDIAAFIKSKYLSKDINILKQCIIYASQFMKDEIESAENEEIERETVINLMTKHSHYTVFVEKLQGQSITVEDIESIDVSPEPDFEELESIEALEDIDSD